MPEAIADILVFLRILLGYGQHLTDTLEQCATARGFSVIAECFGTARVAVILARISRGMLRAIALERVLLARAARGRDLVPYQRRSPEERETQPGDQQQENAQKQEDAQKQEKKRPERRPPEPLPEFPTLEQLEADTRRHPIGRAIAAICCDLGISPTLCEGWFGVVLHQAISWYRGNLHKYYKEVLARRREYAKEWDQDRTAKYDWPERTGEAVHSVLGFLIGENVLKPGPVPMLPGLAAAATGPP